MNDMIIFALPNNNDLSNVIANRLRIAIGMLEFHTFPDEENYIRIHSNVENKIVWLVSTLDHPNNKILDLLFLANTLKEFGAKKVYLIAPYLPYMRQDKRFKSGEAITSILFANLLNQCIDGILTIDSHLHRIKQLSQIYTGDFAINLLATESISKWIKNNVDYPFLIGPDKESEQWVATIAQQTQSSFIICEKKRENDTTVSTILPQVNYDPLKTPILLDDIISSGGSILSVLKQLPSITQPICIATHALFTKKTLATILQAGVQKVVTCNTIPHFTNEIDIHHLIADKLYEFCLKN